MAPRCKVIGNCTLWLGDARDVLPTLGPVDVVITDPPYGEKTHKGARSLRGGVERNVINFASMPLADIRQVLSLCLARRWCVSFMEWRYCAELERCPPEGLEFIRLGLWIKTNPMPQLTGDRPGTGWEALCILHPPGHKTWNGGGAPAVWTGTTATAGNFGPSNHPTEKPQWLLADLLRKFSDPGERIFDPFAGSFSTAIACIKIGRRFVGCEVDERFFDVGCRRIEAAYRQLDLFLPAPGEK